MIGFKEFLLAEQSLPEYLDRHPSAILAGLKKKLYDFTDAVKQLEHGHVLYRGLGSHGKGAFLFNYGFQEKDFRDAHSDHGGNFHSLLDALPSWKEINTVASRKKAFICSSDKTKAGDIHGDAGVPYVILPENGTKLVISPLADIHQGKWKGISGLGPTSGSGLNATGIARGAGQLIAAVFDNAAASNSKKTPNFIPSLKKITLPMIEKAIEETKTSAFKHYAGMMDATDAPTLFDALDELMSPAANGFTLQTIGQPFPANREIWFNGKFCAVRMQPKPTKELQEFCSALKIDVKHFIL
jgi:hypothetical protein